MQIIAYPNCSKGGVSTVIRNRALESPGEEFLAIFANDRGGASAFADLENVRVEIAPADKIAGYILYLIREFEVDRVSVLNLPDVANEVAEAAGERLVYEFHSSDVPWIRREIAQLDLDRVSRLAVPSPQMLDLIAREFPSEISGLFSVTPNLLATSVFTYEGASLGLVDHFGQEVTPIVWVGRLEWRKGDVDFLRILAKLPSNFVGIAVISLERNDSAVESFLNEAAQLGVLNRIHLMMDLDQANVARIFRGARDLGGWFISTSYNESFGYAVREALGCGLQVVAFEPEVPVWEDLRGRRDAHFVASGDCSAIAEIVFNKAE